MVDKTLGRESNPIPNWGNTFASSVKLKYLELTKLKRKQKKNKIADEIHPIYVHKQKKTSQLQQFPKGENFDVSKLKKNTKKSAN